MENLSPMKMSPMKTSPIKNVSNNGRLINKRRMHNQSNKPANKRIRLEFSRNNLRKLATVPEDEKLIYPPPPNINPFYHHDDDDADDDVSTKIEQYENTKTNSLTHSKPMWCKTSSNQQNPSLRMMMSERQRLSRYHQDYQELGTIGSGSFGIVTKCRRRLDGCDYAIKRIRLRQLKTRTNKISSSSQEKNGGQYVLPKEIFAMAALEANPHITRYYSAWVEDGVAYLVLELCQESLQKYIDSTNVETLDEQALLEIMRQILEGLQHLHRNNVVHMDIKPGNILVKCDGAGERFLLGDFGLATIAKAGQEIQEGDTRFMPPEFLQFECGTIELQRSDIFSLGATMLSLALGRDLPKNGPRWQNLRKGKLPPLPLNFSQDFSNLIQSMMNPNPSLRPSASELLKHPMLQDETHKALASLQEELKELLDQRMEGESINNRNLSRVKPELTRRFTF